MFAKRSSKSNTQYFALLKDQYKKGLIKFKDYVVMTAAARSVFLHESDEEVHKWMEEQFEKHNKTKD